MPGPLFPNVPIAPGVPPVMRGPMNPGTDSQPRLTSDSDAIGGLSSAQWGIFDEFGGAVIEPDNVVAIGANSEFRIADFPLEGGLFESYDRVTLPRETRIVMSKGGSIEDRRAFLEAVDALEQSRDLYTVITPEALYQNRNVARVTLDRSQSAGAGLITVELSLREVRQSAEPTFSRTRAAASSGVQSSGRTSAKPTTAPPAGIQ